MKKARCTYCSEIIDVPEYDLTYSCSKCGESIPVKNALEFYEIPDEVANDVKAHRKGMYEAYHNGEKFDVFAREIKDVIPNDFVANYLFAKSKQNNNYFLNKFFQESSKDYVTYKEALFVLEDSLKNADIDKCQLMIDFAKKISQTPVELMQFIELIDDKISEIKNENNLTKKINVIYSNKDYKDYKVIKDALNVSGYQIKDDFDLFTIVVTSENVLNDSNFELKVKKIKSDFFEIKLDNSLHTVMLNDYLGIDNYLLVKENLKDTLLELINSISDYENGKDINLIKSVFKEENQKYLIKLERIRQIEEKKEKEKLEQERLKREKEHEEELRIKLEASKHAAKIKDEEERLDRMEQFIFESYYNPTAVKDDFSLDNEEVTKQIKKVKQLIEVDEYLIAIDLAYDLLLKYPKDYRVYFLVARLESSNFKDINNTTHKKYIEQALTLANQDEKNEMLKEYIPYSTSIEKSKELNTLGYLLNKRIEDITLSIKCYNEGIKAYKAKKFDDAITNWEKSSNLNNPESCYCLAYQYISGKYIDKNYGKAMRLLIKAAKNNHEKSIQMLADIYERGLFGLEKDSDAACYYYSKCIDKSNADLMKTIKDLAEQYLKDGLIDYNKKIIALRYFEMLADNNDVDGMLNAAYLHTHGLGQAYDRLKGVLYYKKAAALKNEKGMVKYAEIVKKGLYDTKKDLNKYVELVNELADRFRDNLEYQKNYIELYEFGLYGVPKSDKLVVKIYEDLARINQNEIYYKLKLAEIYEKGLFNVAVDYPKAINFYNDAATLDQTCEIAQLKLAEIFEKGLYGVKKDLSKVGKIYGILANKYPKNATYLIKLADLFMVSTGKNAFEIAMKYYKRAFEIGSIEGGVSLALGYFNGDFSHQFKDYMKVLEIANVILKNDPNELTSDEEFAYFKLFEAVIKVNVNGGYNVTKNEEKGKELLRQFNEKSKNKLKYKDVLL